MLRPIRLLEVTRKAECGIVKERVRAAVEGAKILDYRQHGGRSGGFSTYSAVTSVARAFEDAIARRLDLHLISVDIRKAYDTVTRTVGLHLAMRRIGIPEDVCEWFLEIGRRNSNLVKCLWEPLGAHGGGVECVWRIVVEKNFFFLDLSAAIARQIFWRNYPLGFPFF